MKQYKLITIIIVTALITGVVVGTTVYVWNQKSVPSKTVQVFASYDCDKLQVSNVEVPKGKDEIRTVLEYLPGPGGVNTIAKYSKNFRVEKGIAYIDWPVEMSNLSNIDTSCALQSFLQPINKTLTQFDSIRTVIHSMGGSVGAFYMRMGLICPKESQECKDYFEKELKN